MSKLKNLFKLNIAFITCSLLLLQIMVVILSWMIKTIYPEFNGRSLLSGEGVRWFLGNFTNNGSFQHFGLDYSYRIVLGGYSFQ